MWLCCAMSAKLGRPELGPTSTTSWIRPCIYKYWIHHWFEFLLKFRILRNVAVSGVGAPSIWGWHPTYRKSWIHHWARIAVSHWFSHFYSDKTIEISPDLFRMLPHILVKLLVFFVTKFLHKIDNNSVLFAFLCFGLIKTTNKMWKSGKEIKTEKEK